MSFKPTIRQIMDATEQEFGLQPGDIASPSRTADITTPRHIAAHICRKHGYTLTPIGKQFGGRDHTTIMNSLSRAENLIEDPEIYAASIRVARALARLEDEWIAEVAPPMFVRHGSGFKSASRST